MKRNSLIRGLVWLIVAMIIVVAAGVLNYSSEIQRLPGEIIFANKDENQIALEFLEIYSYKYEENPVISKEADDYSYDVYRAIRTNSTRDSDLYITFKNLTFGDDNLPTLGLIDALVYCDTGIKHGDLVAYKRLGKIPDSEVYANFLELPASKIENCSSNEFNLVLDISRAETLYNKDILDKVSLSDKYNLNEVSTGALLNQEVSLNDGFEGDISKSSYNTYSMQKAVGASFIAALIVVPIFSVCWYVMEKELFSNKHRK